jgi:hypothetical protein
MMVKDGYDRTLARVPFLLLGSHLWYELGQQPIMVDERKAHSLGCELVRGDGKLVGTKEGKGGVGWGGGGEGGSCCGFGEEEGGLKSEDVFGSEGERREGGED